MSDLIFDQQLVNNSDAAERCMKLGAVILKPPAASRIGFAASQPTSVTSVDPKAVEHAIKRRNP